MCCCSLQYSFLWQVSLCLASRSGDNKTHQQFHSGGDEGQGRHQLPSSTNPSQEVCPLFCTQTVGGKRGFNASTELMPRNNQFLSLLPILHPNSHVLPASCAVSPSLRVMRWDRAAPCTPGSSQLSGQGSAHSIRASCISDRTHQTHQTLGHTQQGLCIIQCCTSYGKLGLVPQGTQGCAEGAQGRSEGIVETGNVFVAVAAFVTIYNSVSHVVK